MVLQGQNIIVGLSSNIIVYSIWMQIDSQIRSQLQGRYRLNKLLGKGSFGNVYECQDQQDGQIYAIKIISKINVKRAKIQTLKQEAKLLQTLMHKNIVKIHQYGEFQSCIYIKMELAKGGTLQAFIERRRKEERNFSDDETASVIGQIMAGLSYIHSLSIIHRDIKPDNILIINQQNLNEVKIADFGLSTKLDSHYPKSAIAKCGTLLFMAPQILCKYTYTKAIDIWSTAIIPPNMDKQNDYLRLYFDCFQDNFSACPQKQSVCNHLQRLGQDFLSRISKVVPNERYTAQQSLKHPWITRKFNDQIPLSVHQSYASFSTGSEIVRMIKLFMGIKNLMGGREQVPKLYLAKIKRNESDHEIYPKEMITTSLKIKKLKSINLERQSLVSSLNSIQNQIEDKKNETSKSRITSQNNFENPTINKLNQIFNTLFDKTITSKNKITYRQKQATTDNVEEFPNISLFKAKVQNQIQKSVRECLQSNKNKNKRILPIKVSPSKQTLIPSDQRIDMTIGSKSSFIRKSKMKKKAAHQSYREELK